MSVPNACRKCNTFARCGAIDARSHGYAKCMTRKQDEKERRRDIRAAKDAGKSPSAEGLTRGAEKQIAHDADPSHPKQKTTHPIAD